MRLHCNIRTQSSVGSSSDNTDFHSVRFHPVQQSMAEPLTEWSTGLCDCCEDTKDCCYCFWCCYCMSCDVSKGFGEARCLPIFDICLPACWSACGIPICVPPAGLSLRVGMRHRYGIKGSHLQDIGYSCVCVFCSWRQMYHELKRRKETATLVVNAQPAAVTNHPVHEPPAGLYPQTAIVLAKY